MKIDLEAIDNLLKESNLSEVAKAVGIPYRTLQAWKLGENKWWKDTQDKLTKLQNHINVEGNTMIKYEELKKVNDFILEDEINDITYHLDENGKVRHRVVYSIDGAERQYPYSAGNPGMNVSCKYSYPELAKRNAAWY